MLSSEIVISNEVRMAKVSPLILIVEDDEDIRHIVAELLGDEGYRVLTARHGGEALDLLRTHPEQPSLIVLDLMMPVMDGQTFRAVQLADEQLRHIPVLVLTAGGITPSDQQALAVAAWERKPLNLERLLELTASLAVSA